MALSTILKSKLAAALRSLGEAEELALYFAGGSNTTANAAVVADANGNYYQSFKDTITAQHSSPGQTGVLLTAMINRITTATAVGDSVVLPPSVAGLEIQVINAAANSIQVFGVSPDTINGVATATGIAQLGGSSWIYSCVTAGTWFVQTGEGYSGNFATQSSIDSLTAQHTSPSQATGVAITKMLTRFSTVATDNDAATLPVSAPGMSVTVINAGAHILGVYPNAGGTTTEVINALSANAIYAQAAAKVVTFFCCTAGQWHTLPA